MNRKQFLTISIGALACYLGVAIICILVKDKEHALMFLVGSVIWIACIFIGARGLTDKD